MTYFLSMSTILHTDTMFAIVFIQILIIVGNKIMCLLLLIDAGEHTHAQGCISL